MTSSVDRLARTVARIVFQPRGSRNPQTLVGLARFSITNLYRSTLICLIPVLMVTVDRMLGESPWVLPHQILMCQRLRAS